MGHLYIIREDTNAFAALRASPTKVLNKIVYYNIGLKFIKKTLIMVIFKKSNDYIIRLNLFDAKYIVSIIELQS